MIGASPFARAEMEAANEAKADGADGEDDDDQEDGSVATEGETGDENPGEVMATQIRENRSKEEVAADDLAMKTFPLVTNELVESWIKYFTGRGRPVMERWLARSTRYIPMMKQVLREQGLPEDLIYLSMIESGFNPKAKSKAKAVGPWQFIKATGQRYDLRVEYWLDERRDYRKSTYAAAEYLKELHDVFGSWYLAAAAYNAGEGRVLAAVRRDRTRNFWELARKKKKNFRAETKNYVPKIIAAALVSKNPEKYGFKNIPYEQPLSWSSVNVPAGVSIRQVASVIGTDEDTLTLLNSELRRDITPPGKNGYELRVPPANKQALVDNLDKLNSKKVGNFMEYVIRKGDTLSTVARRYGTDIEALRDLNQLTKKSKLRPGRELIVPVGGRFADDDSPKSRRKKKSGGTVVAATSAANGVQAVATAAAASGTAAAATPANASSSVTGAATPTAPTTAATVGANTSAAKPAGTSATAAASTAPSPSTSSATVAQAPTAVASNGQHVIQDGDSFWSISKKYGVSLQQLKKANKGKGAHSLRPGQAINVPSASSGG